MTIENDISNAKSISELATLLNNYCEQYDGEGDPVNSLDLSNIHDYSLNMPSDMTGVYSFSDVYLLMRGNGKNGQHFILEAREHFKE